MECNQKWFDCFRATFKFINQREMNILLLYSTGGTNRDIFLNTNFEYLIKSLDKINGVISKIRFHKIQQLYHMIKSPYESLSYVNDWKESFERLKNHNVTSINILNQTKSNTYLKKILPILI